ncbi:MAG: DUF3352 domain-containing protein [Actinomycetota bacterium]|nr:DUF3352 domain-containing protein [Actinomycetota bacterium]
MRRAIPIVLAVLMLAGCGGSETATVGAAALFPADTPLYAEIDSSLDSSEWDDLNGLLDRFPGRDRLVGALRESLRAEGVTPDQLDAAFGDVVAIAVLDFANAEETLVGLTQPDNAQALRDVLEEDELVLREVGDWTAFAENEAALDRLGGDGESLADADRFADAWADLPEHALARVFFDGRAAQEAARQLGAGAAIPQGTGFDAAVLALEAEGDGMRVQGKAFGQEQALPDLSFADEVPAGTILFADFHGSQGTAAGIEQLRSNPLLGGAVEQFEQQLGVTLDDIARLFEGETAVYVRPGVLIPEVTFLLEAEDEAQARGTLDRLGEGIGRLLGAGATRPRTIAGVEATELNLGQLSLYYAVFDGRAVVTTLPTGIEDLREEGNRLADDETFRDARESAGGGDVVLFVDLDEVVGLVERLAQLGEEDIPTDVRANLEPLRAFVVTAEGGDGETSIEAFLSLD